MTTVRRHRWRRGIRTGLALVVMACIVLGGGAHVALNEWPQLGARGAEILRRLVGQSAVAALETAALHAEDKLHQGMYRFLRRNNVSPWTTVEVQRPASAQPSDWELEPISPTASGAPGDGIWEGYLHDDRGRTVARRTVLHPDPTRHYAYAAIVAFDLAATRLHFVLGAQEPRSGVRLPRPGRIAVADCRPGWLLAAFNGGFKAEHGHFGVMVEGTIVLPPRPGLGTIAITDDGHVRLGIWEEEIEPSPHVVAWRQNGPLIVHDGEINPHTADLDPQDWGVTVGHTVATWRSAIGLSSDGATLFYIAGPSLTLPALARAARAARASVALQLDINNYWVHFDAFHARGTRLQAVPLLDAMKALDDSRYLSGFGRDFFYVTLAAAPQG